MSCKGLTSPAEAQRFKESSVARSLLTTGRGWGNLLQGGTYSREAHSTYSDMPTSPPTLSKKPNLP